MHPLTTATNISGPAAALYAQVVSDLTAVRCTKCANVLPRSAFSKCLRRKTGLQAWCNNCKRPEKTKLNLQEAERLRIIEHKKCTKCKELLPYDSFHRTEQRTTLGLQGQCKNCKNQWQSIWNHSDTGRKCKNRWAKNNWKDNEKYRVRHYERAIERYTTDPKYKMTKLLRNRLGHALKRAVNGKLPKKYTNTLKLLGCDMSFFMKHIQKQFKPGMTWENQGKIWHIDHRVPCASFDLTDPEQQRTCFHFPICNRYLLKTT